MIQKKRRTRVIRAIYTCLLTNWGRTCVPRDIKREIGAWREILTTRLIASCRSTEVEADFNPWSNGNVINSAGFYIIRKPFLSLFLSYKTQYGILINWMNLKSKVHGKAPLPMFSALYAI